MKKESKIQIGDDVIFNKQRGNVIGAIGDKWIVQCQYSTYTCESKDLTNLKDRREVHGLDQFKFDKKTQALLFEQIVSCGIYMGRTPIKITGCSTQYSSWRDAKDDDPIRVMMAEGGSQMFPKNQVQILEDINAFANPDNYIEGVIVDESTGEALESVMINVEDYTSSTGEAGPVRILRKAGDEQEIDTVPKAILKTLSV
ncbi:MAG: hypothetical protein HC831_13480 [Chloroflexia bacterium]|nr:hypothetical protein [Chloroflexia bacterium]